LNPRAPSESTRIPGVRLKLILSLAFSSRAFSYFHRASTAACQPPYGCQPVDRLTETGSRRQACHKALRKAIAREPALEVDELRKIDQARSEEMFLNLQPAIRKGNVRAIETGIKVLGHAAKIQGYAAPQRHELTGKDGKPLTLVQLLEAVGPIPDEKKE
jgi:hypothetical protein